MGLFDFLRSKESQIKKIENENQVYVSLLNNIKDFAELVQTNKTNFRYTINGVGLIETRSVRKSNYNGTSFRVAKGVSIRSGSSQSESFDVKKHVDNGKLIITNKKISFVGNNKTRSLDINKIIDIEFYNDGAMFSTTNWQKPVTFFSNNYANGKMIVAACSIIAGYGCVDLINNIKSLIDNNNDKIKAKMLS